MSAEQISLFDAASVIIDNRGKTCPTSDSGIPLIATNCIENALLYPKFEKIRYVDQATYENWFRGHPEPGDLIFVTKGTPGRLCLAPDPVDFCIAQDMVAIRADQQRIDPLYLFAALRSSAIQAAIANMHVGSLIPHFKKGDFDKLFIPLLRRADQQAIGTIYFSLSKKIDVNRRMNEILEAMARAIFKDWFVDFGPTRAKMEGRAPYLAADIWALFPDRLDAEGKPEGWASGVIGDILELQRGFDLPSQDRQHGVVPVIAASGPNGFHDVHMVKGPGVTTGRSGVLGNVFFVHEDFWPLNTSLWVKHYHRATPAFAYCYLSTIDFGVFNAGSAVPTLNRNHVHSRPAVLPPKDLIVHFDFLVMPLLTKQRSNQLESTTLFALRDLLLPKLMSGEIRVKDAEKIVGEAT